MTKREKTLISVFTVAIVIIIAAVVAISLTGRNSDMQAGETQSHPVSDQAPATEIQSTQPQQNDQAQTNAETSQQSTQSNSADVITADEAKSIALKDCGQENNTAIVFTSQKLDYEKGVQVYELDFHDSVTEYEYEINAATGEIVSKSSEPFDYD